MIDNRQLIKSKHVRNKKSIGKRIIKIALIIMVSLGLFLCPFIVCVLFFPDAFSPLYRNAIKILYIIFVMPFVIFFFSIPIVAYFLLMGVAQGLGKAIGAGAGPTGSIVKGFIDMVSDIKNKKTEPAISPKVSSKAPKKDINIVDLLIVLVLLPTPPIFSVRESNIKT